jgi:hypothetical protein
LFLAALIVLIPSHSLAQGSLKAGTQKPDPVVAVMQGFGTAYGMSVTRLGLGSWEGGLLNGGSNRSSFGVIKVFRMGGLYSGIGPVLFATQILGPKAGGVFAAMGYEHIFGAGFFGRLEFNAEVGVDSATQASSALIVGWGWW